jgi:hypothetical protein
LRDNEVVKELGGPSGDIGVLPYADIETGSAAEQKSDETDAVQTVDLLGKGKGKGVAKGALRL